MSIFPPNTRRQFLKHSSLFSALSIPTGMLLAANTGQLSLASSKPASQAYPFSLGVASGSPLPDGVVLWTRILPEPLNPASSGKLALRVDWEVAQDQAFSKIVAKGKADALPALAHSVHVEVTGLQPDRWYWYRFMHGNAVSPVGRTRTAPAPESLPQRLKMVVASCQHWEFGSYCAHQHIANAAPDLIAFLGDYIYEWGPYSLSHPNKAARTDESFNLADYRARYAQYKTDPQLQAAHLVAPWIVTWDDHEVANDYANLLDERLDPNFAARRASAYQAFYEHMPLRQSSIIGQQFLHMRMFQRFDWGRLARLHVLDNRQYRANPACPKLGTSVTASCRERFESKRSILGLAQEQWLEQGFAHSPAQWNLLLQQTLMAQNSQIPATSANEGRFWTDGWDGYPAARLRLLQAMQKHKLNNPIVLSGDVHTFYASNLVADFFQAVSAKNPIIASEFCGTSITSPSRPQARTERYVQDNPHTKFGRSDRRGFMLLDISKQQTLSHFQVVDDVMRADSGMQNLRSFAVQAGVAGVVKA